MANKFEKDELRVTCSPFASGDMGQNPMDEQARRSFDAVLANLRETPLG